jgi:hypothetical protein
MQEQNTMSRKALSVTTSLSALLLTGAAFAGDGDMNKSGAKNSAAKASAPASFADLDTNADGALSRTEAAAHADLSAAFITADVDGNGAISRAEFASWEKTAKAGGASTNSSSDRSMSSTTSPTPTQAPESAPPK